MNANNTPSPSEITAAPDPKDEEPVLPEKDPDELIAIGHSPDPPQLFPPEVIA